MTHRYTATIRWTCEGDFAKGRYSRTHDWEFDGGTTVPASASPSVVPLPYSSEAAVDPEEAFVASVASCHMLWFLDLARQSGFVAETYTDEAACIMEKDEAGAWWIPRVDLFPKVTWQGAAPSQGDIDTLHHKAHEACFIANSIKSDVVVN